MELENLEVKPLLVEHLLPYANNARTHSVEQVKLIASSIREFGFNNPVLIDNENMIIAGHGRVQAANVLGLTEVPTIKLPHLSEAQKKAYILADNRMALDAGWDVEILKLEFAELEDLNFDLDLTGFDEDEIKLYTGDVDEADFPDLSSGDKEPYQQMTFTLHDEQAAIVEEALTKAKLNQEYDTGLNENSNGNALAYICEKFLNAN